jgi:hypothetical protein
VRRARAERGGAGGASLSELSSELCLLGPSAAPLPISPSGSSRSIFSLCPKTSENTRTRKKKKKKKKKKTQFKKFSSSSLGRDDAPFKTPLSRNNKSTLLKIVEKTFPLFFQSQEVRL